MTYPLNHYLYFAPFSVLRLPLWYLLIYLATILHCDIGQGMKRIYNQGILVNVKIYTRFTAKNTKLNTCKSGEEYKVKLGYIGLMLNRQFVLYDINNFGNLRKIRTHTLCLTCANAKKIQNGRRHVILKINRSHDCVFRDIAYRKKLCIK